MFNRQNQCVLTPTVLFNLKKEIQNLIVKSSKPYSKGQPTSTLKIWLVSAVGLEKGNLMLT